jgi:hypothetical protein
VTGWFLHLAGEEFEQGTKINKKKVRVVFIKKGIQAEGRSPQEREGQLRP